MGQYQQTSPGGDNRDGDDRYVATPAIARVPCAHSHSMSPHLMLQTITYQKKWYCYRSLAVRGPQG